MRPWAKPGAAAVAICSTTSSEIISPAILAKRFKRPRMCTIAFFVEGDDVAGRVPTGAFRAGLLDDAGTSNSR
jgi:hypothetical protein